MAASAGIPSADTGAARTTRSAPRRGWQELRRGLLLPQLGVADRADHGSHAIHSGKSARRCPTSCRFAAANAVGLRTSKLSIAVPLLPCAGWSERDRVVLRR